MVKIEMIQQQKTTKQYTTSDVALVCLGLPACRAYSVLIEVTEGTRAVGSKPDKTDFMARM